MSHKTLIIRYNPNQPEVKDSDSDEELLDLFGYLRDEFDNRRIESELVEFDVDPLQMYKAEIQNLSIALKAAVVSMKADRDIREQAIGAADAAIQRADQFLNDCAPITRQYSATNALHDAAACAMAFLNTFALANADDHPELSDRLREPRKRLAIALSKADGKLTLGDLRDELEVARAAGIKPREELLQRASARAACNLQLVLRTAEGRMGTEIIGNGRGMDWDQDGDDPTESAEIRLVSESGLVLETVAVSGDEWRDLEGIGDPLEEVLESVRAGAPLEESVRAAIAGELHARIKP